MTDEQLREFFDGVEMSEEFRGKMKQMLAQPPEKSRPLAAWKPTLIAASIVFVCVSGLAALRANGWLLPSERPVPNGPKWSAAPTNQTPTPSEAAGGDDPTPHSTEPTDPAGPDDPATHPTDPVGAGDPAARPTDPTDPAGPGDPATHPTDPVGGGDPTPHTTTPTDPAGPDDPTFHPTEPQPTDPQPTEPLPTEPQPTEPQPTEPIPTEPQPTEPDPPDPPPEEASEEVNGGFTFDTIGEESEAERLGYLRAVYTKSDTNETVTVTDVENKRTAVVDVTGKLTDSSYRGWYKMFGCTVLVELHPDGEGGWYAFASEA